MTLSAVVALNFVRAISATKLIVDMNLLGVLVIFPTSACAKDFIISSLRTRDKSVLVFILLNFTLDPVKAKRA